MLRVRLAGSEAVWYPAASEQLVGWVETAPWDAAGGARVVRVSGPAGWQAIVDAVGTIVRGLDSGAGVRLRTGQVAGAGAPQDLVASVLGGATGLSTRDWLTATGRALAVDRCVVALDAIGAPAGEAQRLRSTLDEIGATLRKFRSDAVLTVLIGSDDASGPQAWPLDVALPEHADLAVRTETARWSHYLHQRLAWESGGNIDRARRWEAAMAEARLGFGDDEAFEHLTNEWATDVWKRTDAADRDAVTTFVIALRRDEGTGARAALQRKRLVWDPSGVPQLVPWVARAMLREGPTPARRWARSSLVCGLLRKELLQRCLEAEGLARGLLLGTLQKFGRPEDEEVMRAFARGEPRSGREWYPSGCPGVPGDVWDIASFHDVLSAAAIAPDLKDTLHDLRRLRNALAHGHYVSWAMVSAMGVIERKMREGVGW